MKKTDVRDSKNNYRQAGCLVNLTSATIWLLIAILLFLIALINPKIVETDAGGTIISEERILEPLSRFLLIFVSILIFIYNCFVVYFTFEAKYKDATYRQVLISGLLGLFSNILGGILILSTLEKK